MTKLEDELESIELKHRDRLPELPGIYFVINEDREVLYIGRSKNIKNRWLGHHRLEQLKRINRQAQVSIAYITFPDVGEAVLVQKEKEYINLYTPAVNNSVVKRKKVKILPLEEVFSDCMLSLTSQGVIVWLTCVINGEKTLVLKSPTTMRVLLSKRKIPKSVTKILKKNNEVASIFKWSKNKLWRERWDSRYKGINIVLIADYSDTYNLFKYLVVKPIGNTPMLVLNKNYLENKAKYLEFFPDWQAIESNPWRNEKLIEDYEEQAGVWEQAIKNLKEKWNQL